MKWLVLVMALGAGMGPPAARELTKPKATLRRIAPHPDSAGWSKRVDSVFIAGSFQTPIDDGFGALDSMRMDIVGLGSSLPSKTWKPAPPANTVTPYAFRLLAPPVGSGSATYAVFARVVTFRRGLATPTNSPTTQLVIADIAPGGVTSFVFVLTPWP